MLAAVAPLIAAVIHSECVFSRGIRLYQAEVQRLPDFWLLFSVEALFTVLAI